MKSDQALFEAYIQVLNEDVSLFLKGNTLVRETFDLKLFPHPKKYIWGIERDKEISLP